LLIGQKPAGSHRVVWNGQDDHGRPAESGVYFIVLRVKLGRSADEMTGMRKVVLMR
jgi:flagellar hook assembly protein FlgD